MKRDLTFQLRSRMQAVNLHSFHALSQTAGVSRRAIDKLRRGELENLSLGTLQRLAIALQLSLIALLTEFSEVFGEALGGESENDLNRALDNELEGNADRLTDYLMNRPTIDPLTIDPLRLASKQVNSDSAKALATPAQALEIQDLTKNLLNLQAEYDRLQTDLQTQVADLQEQFEAEALAKLSSFLTFYPVAADRARQDTQLPAVNLLPLLKPIEQMLVVWQVRTIGVIGESVAFDPQQHQLIEPFPAQPIQPGDLVQVSHCGYWHRDRLFMRAKVRAGSTI